MDYVYQKYHISTNYQEIKVKKKKSLKQMMENTQT